MLDRCRAALDATTDLVVATGILNIWRHDAHEAAAATDSLRAASGDRFVLGLGVSGHERLIGEEYVAPLAKMRSCLDELDATGQSPNVRVLAALRPRMLELATSRSAGAHPTRAARALRCRPRRARPRAAPGPRADRRPRARQDRGRALARQFCARYLPLPNYTDNLHALGYTDEDLAPPGSDRLVDAIVAWGSAADIGARVQAHLDAGADHVRVQVVRADDGPSEADIWRELAGAVPVEASGADRP